MPVNKLLRVIFTFGLALVAFAFIFVCGSVVWYIFFYVGHQHRTDLTDWQTLDVYRDGWISIELPEDQCAFQLHEYPPQLIGDSFWDIKITPCITTPDGYQCGCVLPKNFILQLPEKDQDAWRSWLSKRHNSMSVYRISRDVHDFKQDYLIGDGWSFTVHVRYFSDEYNMDEIAEDQGAILRILESVQISGAISQERIERCVEEARYQKNWEDYLAQEGFSDLP